MAQFGHAVYAKSDKLRVLLGTKRNNRFTMQHQKNGDDIPKQISGSPISEIEYELELFS